MFNLKKECKKNTVTLKEASKQVGFMTALVAVPVLVTNIIELADDAIRKASNLR